MHDSGILLLILRSILDLRALPWLLCGLAFGGEASRPRPCGCDGPGYIPSPCTILRIVLLIPHPILDLHPLPWLACGLAFGGEASQPRPCGPTWAATGLDMVPLSPQFSRNRDSLFTPGTFAWSLKEKIKKHTGPSFFGGLPLSQTVPCKCHPATASSSPLSNPPEYWLLFIAYSNGVQSGPVLKTFCCFFDPRLEQRHSCAHDVLLPFHATLSPSHCRVFPFVWGWILRKTSFIIYFDPSVSLCSLRPLITIFFFAHY